MNKKSVFIAISILFLLYASYRIAFAVISASIDDANKRGVELYASAIRYAQAAYMYDHIGTTNLEFDGSIDDLNIKIATKVECESEYVDNKGNVELHGCRVEDSKRTYKYVDSVASREDKK